MEFKFTAEHEALRAELQEFLKNSVPPGPGPARPTSQDDWPGQLAFLEKLAAPNRIAPAWPVEYGGLAWPQIKQMNIAPMISGGSNEIQRNIVATRGLGLPRD